MTRFKTLRGFRSDSYETAPYCGYHHETGRDFWGLVTWHYQEGEGSSAFLGDRLPGIIWGYGDGSWRFTPGSYVFRARRVVSFLSDVLDRPAGRLPLSKIVEIARIVWGVK